MNTLAGSRPVKCSTRYDQRFENSIGRKVGAHSMHLGLTRGHRSPSEHHSESRSHSGDWQMHQLSTPRFATVTELTVPVWLPPFTVPVIFNRP